MANKKQQGRFLQKNVTKRSASKQPQRSAPKQPAGKAGSTQITVLTFSAIAVCMALVASIFFLTKLGISFQLPSRTIAADVTVAGVDVGGLTRKEAAEAIQLEIADSYETETLVVNVLDRQLQIRPLVSAALLDVEAVVEEAFNYGTEENPVKTVDIIPYLSLNQDAIKQMIDDFSVNFPTEGEDGTYEIVKETVEDAEVPVLVIQIGTIYYDFDADALYDVIIHSYNNGLFNASYSCNQIIGDSVDLDSIYAENCKEPVDAKWDNETHAIIPSEDGYRFDLEGAKVALAAAKPGEELRFPFELLLPEVDTETIETKLFHDELGTFTAKSGSSYNRDNNLRLACEALDGTILYPGDVFSYNEALGERTAEKGYLPADSYLGDKTVQTYGGGICQPSSCLYYCTLLADLEIVQRSNHGFISSYMPYGMDATVDWKGPDFKFKNSTNYPIRIDAEADGGSVTITLIGTDEKDYYIEMEYEVLSTTSPKTVEEEVSADSGHKDGEVKTSAYTGYTVQTYKCKYDKETDELISRDKEAYSVYAKRDKVVYKVIDDTPEETAPPATEPPATEPPATEPPATEPPATTPPVTDPPATQPPTTEPPTSAPTQAPAEATTPPIGEAGGDTQLPSE